MKKIINSRDLAKRFSGLCLKKKPMPWSQEDWDAYQDGVHGAIQKVPYYEDLTPRDLLKLSWILDDMSDLWKEKAIEQTERGFGPDGEANWFIVHGIDDVKEILIEFLDNALKELEEA